MSDLQAGLKELSRLSVARLLQKVTISYKDISHLSPTIVLGIGDTGHRVLEEVKEHLSNYAAFIKEHYSTARGKSELFTTPLVPEAVEQPLTFLSIPFLDGTSEPATTHMRRSEVLNFQVQVPEDIRDLLDSHNELAAWLHRGSFGASEGTGARTAIRQAIDARLRLFLGRNALDKSLREAINRAVVLRSDTDQAGLIHNLSKRAEIRVFVVASAENPVSSIVGDIIARVSALLGEFQYDSRMAIVLVDDGSEHDNAHALEFRDAGRHIALAAVATVTRNYSGCRSRFLVDDPTLLPPASPVAVAYLLSRELGLRQFTGEDSIRAASLLIFNTFHGKFPMETWSDGVLKGDAVISGFGTSSVVFPWRYLKTVIFQYVLGRLYKAFESRDAGAADVVKQEEQPEPGLPSYSNGQDSVVETERALHQLFGACLLTNRGSRKGVVDAYLARLRAKCEQLEQEREGLEARRAALEEDRLGTLRLYSRIGMAAIIALPFAFSGLAWLLADPANLLDYLSLPNLLAAGAGLGLAAGIAVYFLAVHYFGRRAVARLDAELLELGARIAAVQSLSQDYERCRSEVEMLGIRLPEFYLLPDEIVDFQNLPVQLPIDERKVASTTMYLLVDKLCPPVQNVNLLTEYLGKAAWIQDAMRETVEKYREFISGDRGKSFWALLRTSSPQDELMKYRKDFTLDLARSLDSRINNLAHLGEGVVSRLASLIVRDESQNESIKEVFASWNLLSRPSLPINHADPSRVTRRTYLDDDLSIVRKYLPECLHDAKCVAFDSRAIVRYEFFHGLRLSELEEYVLRSRREELETQLNWLEFQFREVRESVERSLAEAFLVGIRHRLPGIESVHSEDKFAVDYLESAHSETFHPDTPPSRRYLVGIETGELSSLQPVIDSMTMRYASIGARGRVSVREYSDEVRFRPKDPTLWKIILDAVGEPGFFLRTTEDQLKEIKPPLMRALRESHLGIPGKLPGDSPHVAWQTLWLKEGLKRITEAIPDISIPGDALKSNGNDHPENITVDTAEWLNLVESIVERYSELTGQYLLCAKAMYLHGASSGAYGLKRLKILVMDGKSGTHMLGDSFRELLSQIKQDTELLHRMGTFLKGAKVNSRSARDLTGIRKMMNERQELWEKPFSFWSSPSVPA